jgi:hypothetical protein
MKFQDVVGDPAPLAVDSASDTPLPTTVDLLKHAYYLVQTAERANDHWTTSSVWKRVADDLVTLYNNRSIPVKAARSIAR